MPFCGERFLVLILNFRRAIHLRFIWFLCKFMNSSKCVPLLSIPFDISSTVCAEFFFEVIDIKIDASALHGEYSKNIHAANVFIAHKRQLA